MHSTKNWWKCITMVYLEMKMRTLSWKYQTTMCETNYYIPNQYEYLVWEFSRHTDWLLHDRDELLYRYVKTSYVNTYNLWYQIYKHESLNFYLGEGGQVINSHISDTFLVPWPLILKTEISALTTPSTHHKAVLVFAKFCCDWISNSFLKKTTVMDEQ